MALPTGDDGTEVVSGGLIEDQEADPQLPGSTYEDNVAEWMDSVDGIMDPETYGTVETSETIRDQQEQFNSGLYSALEDGWNFATPNADEIEDAWNQATPDIPWWVYGAGLLLVLVLLSDYADLAASSIDRA